jgi:hypothetical protein
MRNCRVTCLLGSSRARSDIVCEHFIYTLSLHKRHAVYYLDKDKDTSWNVYVSSYYWGSFLGSLLRVKA